MGTEKHTAQIESALAVIEIKLVERTPPIPVIGAETVVEPEAFALCLLRIDAHHGFYCSVIPCTGIRTTSTRFTLSDESWSNSDALRILRPLI